MIDKTAGLIVKKNSKKSDFEYWQTQSYEVRLETLELIRKEYNDWKYGDRQEFQKVYKIIKRSDFSD